MNNLTNMNNISNMANMANMSNIQNVSMNSLSNSPQAYTNSNESYVDQRMNDGCVYQMNDPYSPAPSAPIKLFVSSIPKNLTENDLKSIFEEYGPTKDIVFIKDKKPNGNRGNVFVRMESIYYAQQAIRALHSKKTICESLGPLIVKFAIGELEKYGMNQSKGIDQEAKLFVGSLPKDITEEHIRNLFSRFGTVTEVFIMKNSNGVSKRCAFVNFAFKEQGLFAIQNMNGKMPSENADKPIEVRFAESKSEKQEKKIGSRSMLSHMSNNSCMQSQQFKSMHMNSYNRNNVQMNNYQMQNSNFQRPNGNTSWKAYYGKDGSRSFYQNDMNQQNQWNNKSNRSNQYINSMGNNINELTGPVGANIFIFHVPNEWAQNDLLASFSPFGNVISAHIATEKETGRNRGFAFVSYDNVDSAISAVKYMNGFLAHKKKLKVTIKKGEEQYVQALLNQRSRMDHSNNRRNFVNSSHS